MKKLIVSVNTVINIYAQDVKIKPRGAMFGITNIGTSTLVINGNTKLGFSDGFNTDLSILYGSAAKMAANNVELQIQNNTQYDVSFISNGTKGSINKAVVVETFINYRWQSN